MTTARYYTPTGRTIQKPYEGGKYKNAMKLDTLEGDNFSATIKTQRIQQDQFSNIWWQDCIWRRWYTPDYFVRLDTLTKYSVQLEG